MTPWGWPLTGPAPVVPTPAEPWLTQPVATIIAACIAVVAASIAYAGVTYTARNTRRETRRREKLDVLVVGMAALQALTGYVGRVATTVERVGRESDPAVQLQTAKSFNDNRIDEILSAFTESCVKLQLYGFDEIVRTIEPLSTSITVAWLQILSNPSFKFDAEGISHKFGVAAMEFENAMRALE